LRRLQVSILPNNLEFKNGHRDAADTDCLIVDDSETTRRIAGTILRSRHWIICGEAENGRTGVEKFQELRPDLVLLDLSMSDMTGIEVAQRMSAAYRAVPLILFTILEIEGLATQPETQGFVR
jgi:CheY-like chemotaxis protein